MTVRRRLVALLAAAALAVPLAACTAAGGAPSGGPTPTAEPTPAGPGPEDVVATEMLVVDEREVDVAVHPFVRVGDLAVLTLDLTVREPGEKDLQVMRFGRGGWQMHAISNLRAFDLERDVVHLPAVDADGEPVLLPGRWPFLRPAGGRLQVAYAAPEGDALALLLPGAPLIAEVPVVDGEVPSSRRTDLGATASATASPTSAPSPTPPPVLDLDAVADAPVLPLESSSTELAGAVRTEESTQEVRLALDADVLFEFDQATLTPAAAEVLALAAERIAEREPGTVLVVGHTDDQGDESYNLDLSRRRAQAVVDALAGLVDPARYPAKAEGRGEAEPAVPNDGDENRARNRRVTLTLVSTVVTRTELTTTGELPSFHDGVVADAGAPIRLESAARLWDVEASARRVAGHVVVDVRVTARDDQSYLTNVGFLMQLFGHRETMETSAPHSTSGAATVLSGATRLYPLDYRLDDAQWPGGLWFPAANLSSSVRLADGQSSVFSYVFPRLDSPTVTLQFGNGYREDDLRILGVPVTDGP